MKTFDFNRFCRETPGKSMGQMTPSCNRSLFMEDISFRRLLMGVEVMAAVDNNRHVWRPEAKRDSRMQF